jgi:aspartate racemase
MKTIGIIGGLSPASTEYYYRHINEQVRIRQGGHNSAKIILWSANFAEFCALKEKGDWETQEKILCEAAQKLEEAGADFLVLATNTMHKMAPQIQQAVSIPFLHIADATAEEAKFRNYNTLSFLGTKYSMELDFYTGRLKEKGFDVLVPETQEQRNRISAIIYDKLTKGIVDKESEAEYIAAIEDLKNKGAESVILGCTEICLLINEDNSPLPVLDTTAIHIKKTVEYYLQD